MERTLIIFESKTGNNLFLKWLESDLDIKTRSIVRARLNRIILGNLGDTKSLGQGIFELRIHYGAGHRVYFGINSTSTIVLLLGGSKSSQRTDIVKAKLLWREYKNAE